MADPRNPLEGAEMVGGRIEIHHAEDGPTALYLDGQLVGCWKDDYNATECALTLCGVVTVDDNAFLLGGKDRDDAALTLEGVASFRTTREGKVQTAREKRAAADALIAEAAEMDPEGHAELLRSVERAVKR